MTDKSLFKFANDK